jgi:hypothetical protein
LLLPLPPVFRRRNRSGSTAIGTGSAVVVDGGSLVVVGLFRIGRLIGGRRSTFIATGRLTGRILASAVVAGRTAAALTVGRMLPAVFGVGNQPDVGGCVGVGVVVGCLRTRGFGGGFVGIGVVVIGGITARQDGQNLLSARHPV